MSQQNKRIRKWMLTGLTLSLLVPTLAACNLSKGKESETKRTLRVGTMYGNKQDESWFRQQFTDTFEFTHTNIEIEVVPAIDYSSMQFEDQSKQQEQPDMLEKVKEIMTGPNPVDVMIIDMSLLSRLINDNMFKQLDPLLKEDKMDTTDFVPAVIDGIKDAGNGYVYALTPTFTPTALYYNKKIFTKAGVDFPQDGMSWDQILTLAKRLKSGSGKDAVFGLSFNQWGVGDGYWDLQNYSAPLQLRIFDDKAERMTVNTPQWEAAWKAVADLYKDHIVPTQGDVQYDQPQGDTMRYNPFQGRLFLNGKVAMTLGDYNLINEIQLLNDNSDKLKMEKLDWDVVTVPYHVGYENIGNISFSSLSGINTKAANPDDAWEFLKFMNGKEWAKLKSRSTSELSARKEYVKVRDGMSYNVEAFMKTKPIQFLDSARKDQKLYQEKPNLYRVNDLGSVAFNEVIQGKKSVKEALAEWETKGNDLLQKIKLNPKGEINMDEMNSDMSPEAKGVMESTME